MYKVDKDEIITNMNSIQLNINFIENENITISKQLEGEENLKEYMAISLGLFNIINKMIELGEELIDSLDKNICPKTYKEIPQILYNEKIISQEQLKIYKELISYRNEIAHEYDEITPPEIFWCIQRLDFVKQFMKIVKEKLLK